MRIHVTGLQIHGLPLGWMSHLMALECGRKAGKVLNVDFTTPKKSEDRIPASAGHGRYY